LATNDTLLAEVSVPLGKGVARIVAGNAGMMTGPGTNTYLIGEQELAVIDPGPDDERHLQAILKEGEGRIRWILTTHTHRDHSPLTARLKERTGAKVIGRRPPGDGRQDESFRADHEPKDGERLALEAMEVTAIHTPGHASNCVCYLFEAADMLFTGDHILEGVSPVILPPDGDMSAYFDSLDKLSAYRFGQIAPGHGRVMQQAPKVISALRAHRQAREDKVLAKLKLLGSASLDSLVAPVYDDVPQDRHGWARLTLEAHLIKLVAEGKVSLERGEYRTSGA
jgi:glyoxylase-like metal-dependent hydrolase (beta-lactamase superfamily II)